MLWTMGYFLIFVSAFLFMSAYSIGIKGSIEKLHNYHYENVKNGDRKGYCKTIGIGLAVLGLAFNIPSIILIVTKSFNLALFLIGLLLGFGIMILRSLNITST